MKLPIPDGKPLICLVNFGFGKCMDRKVNGVPSPAIVKGCCADKDCENDKCKWK